MRMLSIFHTTILIISTTVQLIASESSNNPPFSCDPSNPSTNSLPFCSTKLPISSRVKDLVTRLTLDEKLQQLVNGAAAVPRLNISAYEWWSEALHGVSKHGKGVRFNGTITSATMFPQIILTAASFDPHLWYLIAQAIGDEARAIFNAGQVRGLTFWAPNINIYRDPRWGRGQETVGEDPLLAGEYAVAYVRGIEGDSFEGGRLKDGHLKISACCKHYTAHDLDNWNGITRYVFDAKVNRQDLADTYQPPFIACVEKGRASGIMCAYNRVNGVPACADYGLLTQTARNQWGFKGYICSDCDAVAIMHDEQGYAKEPEDAVAKVLKADLRPLIMSRAAKMRAVNQRNATPDELRPVAAAARALIDSLPDAQRAQQERCSKELHDLDADLAAQPTGDFRRGQELEGLAGSSEQPSGQVGEDVEQVINLDHLPLYFDEDVDPQLQFVQARHGVGKRPFRELVHELQDSEESNEEAQLLNFPKTPLPQWLAGLELEKADGTKRSLAFGKADPELLAALFNSGCIIDEQKKLSERSARQKRYQAARGLFGDVLPVLINSIHEAEVFKAGKEKYKEKYHTRKGRLVSVNPERVEQLERELSEAREEKRQRVEEKETMEAKWKSSQEALREAEKAHANELAKMKEDYAKQLEVAVAASKEVGRNEVFDLARTKICKAADEMKKCMSEIERYAVREFMEGPGFEEASLIVGMNDVAEGFQIAINQLKAQDAIVPNFNFETIGPMLPDPGAVEVQEEQEPVQIDWATYKYGHAIEIARAKKDKHPVACELPVPIQVESFLPTVRELERTLRRSASESTSALVELD